MDKRTLQTLVILVLLIGVSIGLFFVFFEKAEKTVNTPGSARARQNPFLAAVRFLDTEGIPAEGSNQREFLTRLPSVRDMILIHRSGGNYPESRIQQIASWVERGGILVVHRDLSGKENEPLLNALGLLFMPRHKGKKDNESPAEPVSDPCRCSGKEIVEDVFRGEKMTLAFGPGRALPPLAPSSSAVEFFQGKNGAHVVEKRVGEGRLIVLGDDRLLTNADIGKNDHAFFLLRLSQGRDNVWILYNSIMPSIFSLVMKKMPLMLLSLLVLTVFAFLYLTRRIGPIYPAHDTSCRNIIEHLLAAGHFVRKQENDSGQIQRSRKTLEKKIALRYPHIAKKTRAEQVGLISEWTKMQAEDVRAALDHPVKTTQEYIHTTMLIKTIQDAIAANHKRTER